MTVHTHEWRFQISHSIARQCTPVRRRVTRTVSTCRQEEPWNLADYRMDFKFMRFPAGGPLKPGFGLSGDVENLHGVTRTGGISYEEHTVRGESSLRSFNRIGTRQNSFSRSTHRSPPQSQRDGTCSRSNAARADRFGNYYEFTPPGQEDLHTFNDMLALDLYPAAHDQEALATITSRVLAIAQGANATVLRKISVAASGQQPGEHFIAAVLPTPHGVDFDATRFVLIDKQGVGVFYTHRSYGTSAAGTTSEWVTKNAADVEQQLLQFDASHMVSSVKISTSPSLPAHNTDLPAGTIKKGTLTSPLLMHDTTVGVAGRVAALGCDKVEDIARYVVTPFSGAPRARQWLEKWIVKGCGKQYPVDIDFKEDGAGGAYWTIKN